MGKQIDMWALGLMLFQMLHEGRTPFDLYHRRGRVGVAVAIASRFVYKEVMKLEREKVFADEWRRLEAQRLDRLATREVVTASNEDVAKNNAVLVSSWLRTEALFRMCERCLAFDPYSRVEAGDLSRWMAESGFIMGGGGGTKAVMAQALPKLLPFGGAELSTDVRLSETAVAEFGERVGQVVFAGGVLSGAGGRLVLDETIIVEGGKRVTLLLRGSKADGACGTELAGGSKRCTLIKIFAALGVLVGGLVSIAFFVISMNAAGGGLPDTSIGVPEVGFFSKPPSETPNSEPVAPTSPIVGMFNVPEPTPSSTSGPAVLPVPTTRAEVPLGQPSLPPDGPASAGPGLPEKRGSVVLPGVRVPRLLLQQRPGVLPGVPVPRLQRIRYEDGFQWIRIPVRAPSWSGGRLPYQQKDATTSPPATSNQQPTRQELDQQVRAAPVKVSDPTEMGAPPISSVEVPSSPQLQPSVHGAPPPISTEDRRPLNLGDTSRRLKEVETSVLKVETSVVSNVFQSCKVMGQQHAASGRNSHSTK